jgi:Phage related hypothetical protein (DUF1799)
MALGQLEIVNSTHDEDPDEPDEADAAASAFGIQIEGPRPGDGGGDVYLWPECLAAWAAWVAVQTQWQLGPSGHRCGLDHAGVIADLRAMGYGPGKRRSLRRIHGEILSMERAALAVWFDQVEREQRAQTRGVNG